MKAFIGHSFSDDDKALAARVEKFLKPSIECISGEESENRPVASKIRQRIDDCNIFIGIFTKREAIKTNFWNCVFNRNNIFTTSNWVLQESGYAIAKGKELIFLVEKGVYKFPELQGDLELIIFSRDRFEDLQTKLHEMIESIKKRTLTGVKSEIQEAKKVDTQTHEPKVEDEKDKEFEETDRLDISPEKKAFYNLSKAIMMDKDYNKARELYPEYRKTLKTDDRERWDQIIIFECGRLGDPNAYIQLKTNVDQHPESSYARAYFAKMLEFMGEYEKASEEYLRAAELKDKTNKSDREKIIELLESAIESQMKFLEKVKNYDRLENLLRDERFVSEKQSILENLSRLALQNEDMNSFFVYGEALVEVNPADTSTRFSLAYNYSEKGFKILSMFHYKKLTQIKKHPIALNNLGVEYDNLNLPAKSTSSYRISADMEETLAMANIANKYMNLGFIDDAKKIIKRAEEASKKDIALHKNVVYAKSRLDEIQISEDKEEAKLLAEGERIRKFRLDYSNSYLNSETLTRELFDDYWKTDWGKLKIETNGKGSELFSDQSVYLHKKKDKQTDDIVDKQHEPTLGRLMKLWSDVDITRRINFRGKIKANTATYDIKVVDTTHYTTTEPSENIVHEGKGILRIDTKNRKIYLMNMIKSDKVMFHTWTSIKSD